ncbi:MAG: STAS domain-containing protein, partial [Bryobacteraceae bacterium]
LGEGAGVIRDCIRELVESGNKKLLLNMAQVSYVDSAGLGELVGAFTTVRNRGGAIKLLNIGKKFSDLLQITKLYTVFETHTDEQAAIRSFERGATA